MIVLCNGMPRSGSTWSFHVCEKLLRAADPRARVCTRFTHAPGDCIDTLVRHCDHLIVKSHSLDCQSMAMCCAGAAKVIYTHRDPYDAVASLMQMFGYTFEQAAAAIGRSLRLYQFHRSHGRAMIVPYRELREKPRATIRAISRYLETAVSTEKIGRVDAETSFAAMKAVADQIGESDSEFLVRRPGTVYDKRTHLHRNHLRNGGTGYGRDLLSARQQRVVRKMVREFSGRVVEL
jgi:hypothetical protein